MSQSHCTFHSVYGWVAGWRSGHDDKCILPNPETNVHLDDTEQFLHLFIEKSDYILKEKLPFGDLCF